MRTRYLSIAMVVVSLAAAAGCSNNDTASNAHNQADVSFLQGMIPHHEQAIEMGEAAASKASSPDVKALAERIVADQTKEVAAMKATLTEWGEDAAGAGGHGAGHGSGSAGMLSDGELQSLLDSEGDEFDRLFLEGMTAHHEGAIEAAEAELENGKDPSTKKLAGSIIKAQKGEIAEMASLLKASK